MQLVISGPVQPQPAHPTLTPAYYPHIHTPPLGYPTLPALPAHTALSTHTALPAHTTLPAHAALPAHTALSAHATLPAHAALPTHSPLSGHPVQTFMPGMAFPFRPMRWVTWTYRDKLSLLQRKWKAQRRSTEPTGCCRSSTSRIRAQCWWSFDVIVHLTWTCV